MTKYTKLGCAGTFHTIFHGFPPNAAGEFAIIAVADGASRRFANAAEESPGLGMSGGGRDDAHDNRHGCRRANQPCPMQELSPRNTLMRFGKLNRCFEKLLHLPEGIPNGLLVRRRLLAQVGGNLLHGSVAIAGTPNKSGGGREDIGFVCPSVKDESFLTGGLDI
jgi:hypothetical protein